MATRPHTCHTGDECFGGFDRTAGQQYQEPKPLIRLLPPRARNGLPVLCRNFERSRDALSCRPATVQAMAREIADAGGCSTKPNLPSSSAANTASIRGTDMGSTLTSALPPASAGISAHGV